jgi:hypothetical protein
MGSLWSCWVSTAADGTNPKYRLGITVKALYAAHVRKIGLYHSGSSAANGIATVSLDVAAFTGGVEYVPVSLRANQTPLIVPATAATTSTTGTLTAGGTPATLWTQAGATERWWEFDYDEFVLGPLASLLITGNAGANITLNACVLLQADERLRG